MKVSRSTVLCRVIPVVLLAVGCTRDISVPSSIAPSSNAVRASVKMPAVVDSTMGDLSPTAQFISAALQDSTTRMLVLHALRASGATAGLDLQACADDPTVAALMQSGEHRGAGNARAVCGQLAARGGLILWMNPGRLARWDGRTLPIVGALAHPFAPPPPTIPAYRSPNRMIDLPADGSLGGPILMVLPIRHPGRAPSSTKTPDGHRVLTSGAAPTSARP